MSNKVVSEHWVILSELDTNLMQPPDRTKSSGLSVLKQSLERHGQLKTVAVALLPEGKLVVLDGHRTIAALDELDIPRVRCSITPMSEADAELAFAALNGGTRPIRGKSYLYQWSVTSDRKAFLDAIGCNRASLIRKFAAIFGDKVADEYGRTDKVDPSVVNVIARGARAIAVYDTPPSSSAIGHYLISNKAQVQAQFVAAYGTKQQVLKLAKCIRSGEPLGLKVAKRRRGRVVEE